MALTATAQNKVEDDIIRSLGIRGCSVLRQSFNRPNLHYEVRPKMKNFLKDMVGFINAQGAGASGIIYCASRNKCEDLAKELRETHGLKANHYHAGMSKGDRRNIQEGWQEQRLDIIVATVSCVLPPCLAPDISCCSRWPSEWGGYGEDVMPMLTLL